MKKLVISFMIGTGLVAGAVEFHVDPKSASGGDGSAKRPFATLVEARDGVRAARKSGKVAKGERVDVVLAAGDYEQIGPLDLAAQDGGDSAAAPVTWRAAEPGKVRVLGASRVPNAAFSVVTDPAILARLPEEARGNVWQADVSALFPGAVSKMAGVFTGVPSAPILFFNNKFGVLARWPNDGFTSFSVGVDRGEPIRKSPNEVAVYKSGAFIYSDPRAKRWNFAEGVWLNGYWTHDWDNWSVRVASYGEEDGTNDVMRLAGIIPYGVMGGTWGRKERRFFAFNLLDEVDMPGEWYLDRVKKVLYFYPPNGRLDAADEVYLASTRAPMVRSVDKVSHIRFEGIVFEYSYDSGAFLRGDDIRVDRCKFLCVGKTGACLRGDGNLMTGCEVAHIGATGVACSGGDRKTLRRACSTFEGNHVHDFGIFQRTYAPGFAVGGCGITLRGNVIHNAPHSAVLYGGNEHLFEYNNVYSVLLETGDAGAYYTGRDWTTQGNVLRFNYTHDLGMGTTAREGSDAAVSGVNTMGFYFDDCDCGDEVYGNIFHNIARGIMIGGGREHPVRNNIFSRCNIAMSIDCRGMTWKHWNNVSAGGSSWLLEDKAKAFSYTNGVWAAKYPRLADIMNDYPREPLYNPVENNIFIDCRGQLVSLGGNAPLEHMAPIANNVVVNTLGTNGVSYARPDRRIASAFTILNGSTNAPCSFGFADASKGDFHFLPGAEVLKACPGFQTLPLDRIPPSR